MTDYKDMAVSIPYKTFKERCRIVNDLLDDNYEVEYTDEYVIGIKKLRNRRKKHETRKFKRKNDNKF